MSDDRPQGSPDDQPGSGDRPAQPPEYGSPPPAYGSQPPEYGSQPPAYGSPPPSYGSQPPGGGYPAESGYRGPVTQRFSVGDAFGYGWRKYWPNVGTIIVAALIYLVLFAAVQLVTLPLSNGEVDGAGGAILSLISTVLLVVVSAVMQAGIARGVLEITHGRSLEVGTMFRFDNLGTVIIASLLVGIATGIGFLLLFIPGLVVIFLTQFTVWFIVDRQLGVIDAIKESCRLVGRNVGPMLLFFLASVLAYLVGAILILIGLLVAVPVVYIAQGYAYRTLQGEPVAP